jgi:hypothetical protein
MTRPDPLHGKSLVMNTEEWNEVLTISLIQVQRR